MKISKIFIQHGILYVTVHRGNVFFDFYRFVYERWVGDTEFWSQHEYNRATNLSFSQLNEDQQSAIFLFLIEYDVCLP